MISMSYEQIIEKIHTEKGLSISDIEYSIKNKLRELGELVSKEGAAYIIANEHGVKIFEDFSKKTLKINQIMAGMSSVNIVGKVVQIYAIHEFNTGTRQGKVANLLIGDETGTIRLVMWDTNHIKELENNNISLDKVIKVKNAYVKENNGFKEIHMGNRAILDLNPEETIETVNRSRVFSKKQIKDLMPGENATISGTVVQIFEPRFYEACSECNKKIDINNGVLKCEFHPNASAVSQPILNLYLDDGSESIRTVAFRDSAEKIITNIRELKENPGAFEEIRNDLLGSQFRLSGKVSKNEMFDRKEFIINDLEVLEPEDVVKEFIEEKI